MVSYQLISSSRLLGVGYVFLKNFGYYLSGICDRNVRVEIGDVYGGEAEMGECRGVFEFCDHVRGVFQVVCVGNWGHMSDFVGEESGQFVCRAPRQLTTGPTGCSGLCSLISPIMVSAVGFMFTYFYLV